MNTQYRYQTTLKMWEAEEIADLLFFRPLAYLFVRAVRRTRLRPNHVSALSLACGLIAAAIFAVGSRDLLVWAAVVFAVANILDCADGQLARIQQSGTLFGRVIDGVADYIVSVAIFLALGFNFGGNEMAVWGFVIAAGVSSGLHAILFDHYQNEFICTVRGESNFLDSEQERFTDELARLKSMGKPSLKPFLLQIYLSYIRTQKSLERGPRRIGIEPADYRSTQRRMIRMWSFLGLTTDRSILILCALAGSPEMFLWIIAVAGNLWMLVCFLRQRRINRLRTVSVNRHPSNM